MLLLVAQQREAVVQAKTSPTSLTLLYIPIYFLTSLAFLPLLLLQIPTTQRLTRVYQHKGCLLMEKK